MTISEAEERTGLLRSNIRFYEKEGLVTPVRLPNGYRDYTQEDVAHLQKIAFLRMLGLSVEEIRAVMTGKEALPAALEHRLRANAHQRQLLDQSGEICREMLADPALSYDRLQISRYAAMETTDQRQHLRHDAWGLMTFWGSPKVRRWIAAASLLLALLSLPFLPGEIPVQWEGGAAVSHAPSWALLAYPAACLLLMRFLRPVLMITLRTYFPAVKDMMVDYAMNVLCSLLLLVEGFTLLYLLGVIRNLPVLLTAGVTAFGVVFLLGIFQQW